MSAEHRLWGCEIEVANNDRGCLVTCSKPNLYPITSNLLQIALDDEMFDVGPSNHKSLTLLKVYAP